MSQALKSEPFPASASPPPPHAGQSPQPGADSGSRDESLRSVTSELTQQDLSSESDAELIARLTHITRLRTLIESFELRSVMELRRRDGSGAAVSRTHGAKTSVELIARVTGRSYAAAQRLVELADISLGADQPDPPDPPAAGVRPVALRPVPDPPPPGDADPVSETHDPSDGDPPVPAGPDSSAPEMNRSEPAPGAAHPLSDTPSAAVEASGGSEPPGAVTRQLAMRGTITVETAHLILTALKKLGKLSTARRAELEREWIGLVSGELPLGVTALRRSIQNAIAAHTPRVSDRDRTNAEQRRHLRFTDLPDGMVRVSGVLTAETAATLGRCFDLINTPVHTRLDREDSATPEEVRRVLQDPRTAGQRNHDALMTIASVALSSRDMPAPAGKPAVVLMHVTEARARDPQGTAVVSGHDGGAAIIPVTSVHQSACAGALQRLIHDSTGRIVALEHESRLFTAHQRRAMAARDGGCVIPGCGIPPGWCESHHVESWARTKRTRVDSGVLLCWFHHHTIDTSGWQIRIRNHQVEVKPPRHLAPSVGWIPAARGVNLLEAA